MISTVEIVLPFASVKLTAETYTVVEVLSGCVTVMVEPAGQKAFVEIEVIVPVATFVPAVMIVTEIVPGGTPTFCEKA